MPALPKIIRGSNMIAWREQEPDFIRRPLDALVSNLPFMTACAITLAGDRVPRVLVPPTVMARIMAHLQERNIEMGGLLLGNVHDGLSGGSDFTVNVMDFARSVDFDGTSVSLRMDPDVWERARAQTGQKATVIGWYHSHPNLGVFFSGTDRKTQRDFFNQPHSLGLVVDPIRLQEKWFIGPDSIELRPFQIIDAGLRR
jgi:proteasome lid subunit RPN8/RPN11